MPRRLVSACSPAKAFSLGTKSLQLGGGNKLSDDLRVYDGLRAAHMHPRSTGGSLSASQAGSVLRITHPDRLALPDPRLLRTQLADGF